MMKQLLLLGLCFFMLSFSFAQDVKTIQISNEKSEFEVISKSNSTSFEFVYKFGKLNFTDTKTKEGNFYSLTTDGLIKTYNEGNPDLPVLSKLIEVPQDAKVKVNVVSYDEETYLLKDYGIENQIIPAQASVSKSEDFATQDFVINYEVYDKDAFTSSEIASYQEIGQMRATRLGRVQVNPIQYNPVTNEIKVLNNITIEVVFENENLAKTQQLKEKYYSPYFSQITTGNTINKIENKALIQQSPVVMAIVADPMFEAQLQEFINWKVKKGFTVIEGYTDEIGTTTTAIKAWLQDLYENPEAGVGAPTFVLIVGDHAQIPAWAGSAASHYTDLRYCEYTGDDIPEVFYGRFSATSTDELQPQIDKTLEYEQYLMTDPSYLSEVVMVAGDDSSYEMVYGNGQISYGVNYYFNGDNDITSHTYLQPLDNSSASTQIIQNVSDGVAFGNYTAHCSPDGWATPSFINSDIAGLQNEGKYGLLVGNCCQSNQFVNNAFGENLLRAVDKGAIGYIGGTNSTYWDEDYWWGVGLISPAVADPTYENSGTGAYDAMFHNLANEVDDISKWYITQGQMVVGGNMAVEASTSTRKQYYWEIYTLMGDPSLMPFIGVPDQLSVALNPTVIIYGTTSLDVTTEPYAYVALSQNGVLVSTAMADASGDATLEYAVDALVVGTDADLVVTAQNKQPYFGTVNVISPDGAYIIIESYTIDDSEGNNNGLADYNETFHINLTLKNVGTQNAQGNVTATMTPTTGTYYTLANNVGTFGVIPANDNNTSSLIYTVTTSNNIPDQTTLTLNVAITDGIDSWNPTLNFKVNAPAISIGNLYVQDDESGDGRLDPDEQGSIVFDITNSGHAEGTFSGDLSVVDDPNNYLTLSTTTVSGITLLPDETQSFIFDNAYADALTPLGTPVGVQLDVVASDEYAAVSEQDIIIGIIPVYLISDENTITVCTGTSYDSGNSDGNYSDDENYTYTFLTPDGEDFVVVEFIAFELDSYGNDKLYVYDGPDDTYSQIEGSPFTSTNSPGLIAGANGLTFNFQSSSYTNAAGWEANVSCFTVTEAPDCATTPVPATGATNIYPTTLSWSALWADSYDVYLGTNTDPLTNTPVNVTERSMLISLKPFTTYYWTVIPKNSIGDAEGCDVWTFETGAVQYIMTNTTVETCEGVFYDDGGDENYASSQDLTMTFLTPEGEDFIVVDFTSFETESCCDKLYIYNGPDNSYPEIEGSPFLGTNTPGTVYGANGLTFYFHSDGSVQKIGWVANVSCYSETEVPDCASNPVPANEATNVFPTVLTWNSPMASSFDVYFGTNVDPLTNTPVNVAVNEYPITISPNTTYYWTVIPKNSVGDAVGCDVWTFESGAAQFAMADGEVTTCEGVFYDSGLDGQYQNNEDYTMTFYPATEGAMLHFEFTSFDVELGSQPWDHLDVYDGSSINAQMLGSFSADDGAPVPDELTNLTATNEEGAITFVFHSDGSGLRDGWTANISCIGGSADYYNVDFTVQDATSQLPIENASVEVNSVVQSTDNSGLVTFELLNGSYTYTVSAENYFTQGPISFDVASEDMSFTINMVLSTSVEEFSKGFDIYPNPNNGLFTVETEIVNSEIEIFDVTGKKLYQSKLENKVNEINISEFSKGVYIVKISNIEGIQNSIIVIE